MFTETITLERHIEELRAELRGTADATEASEIRAELDGLLVIAIQRQHDQDAL